MNSNDRRSLQVLCDQSSMDSDDVITGLIRKERWANKASPAPAGIEVALNVIDACERGAMPDGGILARFPQIPNVGDFVIFGDDNYFTVAEIGWSVTEHGSVLRPTVWLSDRY